MTLLVITATHISAFVRLPLMPLKRYAAIAIATRRHYYYFIMFSFYFMLYSAASVVFVDAQPLRDEGHFTPPFYAFAYLLPLPCRYAIFFRH